MKLVGKKILKNGAGSVILVPKEEEDMWHVYNLVAKGDLFSEITMQTVMCEMASGGRIVECMQLKVEVEIVEYDKVASVIQVWGKFILKSKHLKLGAYHTIHLNQHRPFVLAKVVWDVMAKDYLKQACNLAMSANIVVVMMQEGLANIYLIGAKITTMKRQVKTSIPRKHKLANGGYDKALNIFFENVLQAVLCHMNFSAIRSLIIASPGFTKDQFFDYMMLEATGQDLRQIIENKGKIILTHSSLGYKHALKGGHGCSFCDGIHQRHQSC